ncbi:MAG: Fe-S cluster assembly protein SufD [Nocardioidaceae bacterium]|nr:Fe-S cluster assembly protein SufD [Nocardioidaceae bacterium]
MTVRSEPVDSVPEAMERAGVQDRTPPAEANRADGTAAAATAGPGTPIGGPGVKRKPTGGMPRVLSRDPDAFAEPTGREEEWRFTPLRRLRGLVEGMAEDGTLEVSVSSVGESAERGAKIERIGMDDPRVGTALAPADRVTALAMAAAPAATLVSVPAEETDALVTLVARGEGGTAYRHLVIEVGRFARATVVLDHVGTGTFAANVEMLVGDGAELTVVSLQDWDDDAVHLGAHAARLGRDAKLKHIAVTLGGETVRLLPTVTYAGGGGDAEFFGLSFTDAGQHHEHRLFVDHAVSNCRSRVHYKSALQGDVDGRSGGKEAHAVWVGDVLIRANALATDTYELNRNLVLSDGARADSIPNLEIETGEVTGAGHASATGRFDDEALFYLMSRGISAKDARRLVVRGFFAEIVAQIPLEDVRNRVSGAIEDELGEVGL